MLRRKLKAPKRGLVYRAYVAAMRKGLTDSIDHPERGRRSMDLGAKILPSVKGVRVAPAEGADAPRGEWLEPTDTAAGALPVVLFVHGGAYTIGSPTSHRWLSSRLARAGMRVFSLDYRLAPEHPFPAALDDALAAYRWLLGQTHPMRLTIAGDSAGGGLAVATMVRAREEGLALPAGAACISPWTDLTCTAPSHEAYQADDYLVTEAILQRARRYAAGRPLDDPLISPLYADLSGLPPMLVQVGGREILRDDSERLVARAVAAGVHARLSIYEGEMHVWHQLFWLRQSARRAIREVGEFLLDATGAAISPPRRG